MKKILLSIFAVALLSGCAGQGERVQTSKSRGNYDVHFLFEVDSVKVYRFYDAGHWVYFTNANGRCGYAYSNGKASIHVETICNADN